jgi:hypothetical protein
MQGIFHAYYTVAPAPAIAVVAGMGVAVLWERGARRLLGVITAGTAAYAVDTAASAHTGAIPSAGPSTGGGFGRPAGGLPVMAVGGFNGTDPAPTLEQFKQYVAEKKIHYFIGTGMGSGAAARVDVTMRPGSRPGSRRTTRPRP